MSDLSYSFTVAGQTLEELVDRAFKRARELLGDTPLAAHSFYSFHVNEQRRVDGSLIYYEADCTVVVPMRTPEPALHFGTL